MGRYLTRVAAILTMVTASWILVSHLSHSNLLTETLQRCPPTGET